MILPILQILLFFSSRKYTIAKNSTFELHTWLSNYYEIQFGNWKTTRCILINFRTFDMQLQDQKTQPMKMIYRVPKSKQFFFKNQILAA